MREFFHRLFLAGVLGTLFLFVTLQDKSSRSTQVEPSPPRAQIREGTLATTEAEAEAVVLPRSEEKQVLWLSPNRLGRGPGEKIVTR